jgi:hypothetical protein
VQTGASIGIAVSPEHGGDIGTLLRHADIAMYRAKRSQTEYLLYTPEGDGQVTTRAGMELLAQLRRAIEHGDLAVHYQPKLNLRSGDIVGVEALVRWPHPERGMLYPDHFLPLARQNRLMRAVTEFVVDRARPFGHRPIPHPGSDHRGRRRRNRRRTGHLRMRRRPRPPLQRGPQHRRTPQTASQTNRTRKRLSQRHSLINNAEGGCERGSPNTLQAPAAFDTVAVHWPPSSPSARRTSQVPGKPSVACDVGGTTVLPVEGPPIASEPLGERVSDHGSTALSVRSGLSAFATDFGVG